MSGRSVASALVLVGVLSVSGVCQADMTPSSSDPTKSTDPEALPATQTRLLTIKTIVSTLVSTVSHTVMVYPTCTTAASGVSACPGGDPLPTRLTTALPSVPATPTPQAGDAPSTTSNLMEVVLPSCDCGDGGRSNRTPKFLSSGDVITLKTTTTVTLDKVLTVTAPTTVSLTYNGCVPTDAISTTPCLAPSTSTSITTSSAS